MPKKLSALLVKSIKKVGWHGDGDNLWLQVTASGSKSWVFRYTRDGKQRVLGLGPLGDVSLALARERAYRMRLQLLDGVDPAAARLSERQRISQEQAKALTFDAAANQLIDSKRAGWRNVKHSEQWSATLRTYVSPVVGHLDVSTIDTPLIVKCLKPIWTTKTETASRVRQRIEAVLDWAAVAGFRSGDNPARWKGHLEHILPAPQKVAARGNHPSLPWRLVPAFMQSLRAREGVSARALEFTILCAARTGEVRGAKWQELDLEAGIWTVPADRMKAGREHQVPLSSACVALLKNLPRVKGTDLVFPGSRSDTKLSDASLGAVIKRMNEPPMWLDERGQHVVPHGFRSSFRVWAAEATSHPREAAEHALAHQLPDKVEAAYQRGTLFPRRVSLMEDWAQFVASTGPKPL
jgi:integrase